MEYEKVTETIIGCAYRVHHVEAEFPPGISTGLARFARKTLVPVWQSNISI